ncbi:MAG: flagellar assembly peptidoglycan hydrolase FlgJ [Granulosicoccus sp.]
MTELPGAAGDITLALQNRLPLTDFSTNASSTLGTSDKGDSGKSEQLDDAKAREAATKFEALLIHNMLKSMRKTTMSEGKSNERAIYDDMLDEKLAETMIKAGGIGIADQIVFQIRQQQGKSANQSENNSNTQRLKELASHIHSPAGIKESAKGNDSISNTSTNIGQLRLATALWSSPSESALSQKQQDFIQPLLTHARRNAGRLGTSPDVILAVAALETGWGQSPIKDKQGNNSHNLFGIKATGSDNRYATTQTTEYIEGSPQKLHARFKMYDSTADAVDGFANFILSNPRYSNALKHAGNPEKFLQELQNAGYATDPRYAEKAMSIMRQIARNPLPL